MSPATVTIRDLKNKDTGIDLTIPTYKEIKGMLGSSYEYHVMVVSNLSYFKTAKHKESDNVQFMTPKKFADFEDLYTKMNTKYSGTAFPPLPKKVLLMNDSIAKERRGGLEYILKFLAMTPKLCTCPLLLEFLGVKAGRIKSMTVSDKGTTEESKQPETEEQEGILGTETQEPDQTGNLFDEEEGPDEDNDMFSGVSSAREEDTVDTKIFEDQEMGGAIEEGDDNLFLVDAKIDHGHSLGTQQSDGEDNSDLFQIDDDLDRIMALDLKLKTETVEEQPDHDKTEGTGEIMTSLKDKNAENIDTVTLNTEVNETITETDFDDIVAKAEKKIEHVAERPKPAPRKKPQSKDKTNVPKRPDVVKDKPVVPKRPEIPKDKPNVPKRPEIAKDKPNVPKRPEIAIDKPNLPKRPDIAAKPKVAEKPNIPSETDIDTSVGLEAIQDESDILKYIQENAANEDDVDLFS